MVERTLTCYANGSLALRCCADAGFSSTQFTPEPLLLANLHGRIQQVMISFCLSAVGIGFLGLPVPIGEFIGFAADLLIEIRL